MTDKETPEAKQPEPLRLAALLNEGALLLKAASSELCRQHSRISELGAELEAVGAGGVQALSAARAAGGWVPPMPVVFKFEKNKPKPDAYAAYTVGQLHEAYRAGIAAAATPPAEQQATPEAVTPKGDATTGAALGAEPGAVYAELPDLIGTEINDACWAFVKAMPHDLPGPIWNDLKPAVHAAICRFLQAAPKAAPVPSHHEEQPDGAVIPVDPSEMQAATELGPDGKEWAKTEAGYKHVESLMAKADGETRAPYWHGWALRGAFVAGAEGQEGRGAAPKDHELRELVNRLRDIAREFHGSQQLRERIAAEILPMRDSLAAPKAATGEPVHGDKLPPVGSRVFIRHGRDDDAHACTVTGYYAWSDLGGNKSLHRVFVRLVYEGTDTQQARMLCDCYPTAEAALAQAAPQQEAQEPALFVSAKQLAALTDPDDPDGEHGRYLPVRKTSKGLFTQALYTAPQPAPAPLSEREAFEAKFGVPGGVHWDVDGYVVNEDYLNSYLCNRFVGQWKAWQARAALAAQGGK